MLKPRLVNIQKILREVIYTFLKSIVVVELMLNSRKIISKRASIKTEKCSVMHLENSAQLERHSGAPREEPPMQRSAHRVSVNAQLVNFYTDFI